MELSIPLPLFKELLSFREVYFYENVLPYILISPWLVLLIIYIVKKIYSFYKNRKKDMIAISEDSINKQEISVIEEKVLKLKEIESLAYTDPRKALFALSKYIRKVDLKQINSIYSLEYFISKYKNHQKTSIYNKIILHSYKKSEPDTDLVLSIIMEFRKKG